MLLKHSSAFMLFTYAVFTVICMMYFQIDLISSMLRVFGYYFGIWFVFLLIPDIVATFKLPNIVRIWFFGIACVFPSVLVTMGSYKAGYSLVKCITGFTLMGIFVGFILVSMYIQAKKGYLIVVK